MTDTQILDWLEQNSSEYLVVPPNSIDRGLGIDPNWSLFQSNYFLLEAPSLRQLIIDYLDKVQICSD